MKIIQIMEGSVQFFENNAFGKIFAPRKKNGEWAS
jgi:hypothetical protein